MKSVTTLYTDGTLLLHRYENIATDTGHVAEAWLCTRCSEVHTDEEDALDCCRPRVEEGYQCPTCKTFFTDDDEAAACCDDGQIVEESRTTQVLKADARMIESVRNIWPGNPLGVKP
jgi:hypothetical protein